MILTVNASERTHYLFDSYWNLVDTVSYVAWSIQCPCQCTLQRQYCRRGVELEEWVRLENSPHAQNGSNDEIMFFRRWKKENNQILQVFPLSCGRNCFLFLDEFGCCDCLLLLTSYLPKNKGRQPKFAHKLPELTSVFCFFICTITLTICWQPRQ